MFGKLCNYFNPKPIRTEKRTIKEWMYSHYGSSTWYIHPELMSDDQAHDFFYNKGRRHKETGREFEIEVDIY